MLNGNQAWRRRLYIMVKEPRAGCVKTRLARDIGAGRAAAVYRHMVANVVGRLSRDARWQTRLCVAPPRACGRPSWPPGVQQVGQASGDIGARMQAIFELPGRGPVVVIGTDIPGVQPAHIAAAFQALGGHDVVFGPAADGGFWLVGMRRCPRVFKAFVDGVRWSAPETLADCLAGLGEHRVATVATLRDVDEADDLMISGTVIGRRVLGWPFGPGAAGRVDRTASRQQCRPVHGREGYGD